MKPGELTAGALAPKPKPAVDKIIHDYWQTPRDYKIHGVQTCNMPRSTHTHLQSNYCLWTGAVVIPPDELLGAVPKRFGLELILTPAETVPKAALDAKPNGGNDEVLPAGMPAEAVAGVLLAPKAKLKPAVSGHGSTLSLNSMTDSWQKLPSEKAKFVPSLH